MGACQSLLLGDGPIKAGPPSSTVAANQMPTQAATNKQSVLVRSRNIDSTNKISPPEEEIAEEIPEEINKETADNIYTQVAKLGEAIV